MRFIYKQASVITLSLALAACSSPPGRQEVSSDGAKLCPPASADHKAAAIPMPFVNGAATLRYMQMGSKRTVTINETGEIYFNWIDGQRSASWKPGEGPTSGCSLLVYAGGKPWRGVWFEGQTLFYKERGVESVTEERPLLPSN